MCTGPTVESLWDTLSKKVSGSMSMWQTVHGRLSVYDLHHVQTKENLADLTSTGASARELLNNRLWWRGPEFLSNHNLTLRVEQPSLPSDDPELRTSTMVHSATTTKLTHADLTGRLEYFSNWYRAHRVVANCRRCLARLREKFFNVGQPTANGPVLMSSTVLKW